MLVDDVELVTEVELFVLVVPVPELVDELFVLVVDEDELVTVDVPSR